MALSQSCICGSPPSRARSRQSARRPVRRPVEYLQEIEARGDDDVGGIIMCLTMADVNARLLLCRRGDASRQWSGPNALGQAEPSRSKWSEFHHQTALLQRPLAIRILLLLRTSRQVWRHGYLRPFSLFRLLSGMKINIYRGPEGDSVILFHPIPTEADI